MPDDPTRRPDPEATRTGSAPPAAESLPLTRLGDFELLSELGRGGMGVVYEARQISLKRRVALKVLPPAMGLTRQARQRFEREAQAAAKLHHTNIVPVHAIGEQDGYHYYAMDLIEGQSLDHILREMVDHGENALLDATVTRAAPENEPVGEHRTEQKPAPRGESRISETVSTSQGDAVGSSLGDTSAGNRRWFQLVARLIAEVADGLDYAHRRGVIHRDIKPANLMLGSEGRLFITDFGLARLTQEPGMTVSGSFLGTPAYMSPEQVAAGRMKLDHRTDVYSLGAVLYELLTLQRPFPGESRDVVIGAIMTKDPRAPRRFNAKIPVDLETICLKALEKDADRRYASGADMARDLRQYLQGGLITARRAGLTRRAWKSVRRHPVAAAVTVGLVSIALLGTFAQRLWVGRSAEEAGRLVAAAENDLREGTYRQGLENVAQALAIDPGLPSARRTQGRLLFEANTDPRELVLLARELLEEAPEDWEAHGWLAFSGARTSDDWGLGDVDVDAHLTAVERSAPDTAEAWYVRGIVAESQSERLRYFDRVLELDPGHGWALLWRSAAKGKLRDIPSAIADAQAAIAVRPRSTRGRRWLAGTYLWAQHDIDRALEEYDKAAAIDPEDPRVYHDRSWIFRPDNRDDRERRLGELSRAVELAPEFPWLLTQRAHALNDMSRFEDSITDSRKAVEIEPHDPDHWSPLLWSLWRLQRHDEVREVMAELHELADGWPNRYSAAKAFRVLSYYRRGFGDHEGAVAAAERAIELDPKDLDGYAYRADALAARGGSRVVQEDCDRMRALPVSEPEPLNKRARFMINLCGRPDAALEDLAAAIELAPQWAEPFHARGSLRFDRSEYSQALDDFDAAIERAPQWPEPHRSRGNALRQLRHYDEALASISRAIELAPKHTNAIYNRGQLYFSLERYENALEDLERCFTLVGGRGGEHGRWLQAQALRRLGRDRQALDVMDLAIGDKPQFALSHQRKATLLLYMGRMEEMEATATHAVEVAPADASSHFLLAVSRLLPEPRCADALADLQRASELAPDDPGAAEYMAWIQTSLLHALCPDHYDGNLALDLARKALEENPETPGRQMTYGWALYRHGRFDEARDALARAVELQTPKPLPWQLFALATVEQRLSHPAEARRLYEEAVARTRSLAQERNPWNGLFQKEAADLLGM